jgi:hypothetical protein
MFHCIQRGQKSGKRVHEQLVWFAWRWNGKAYHSDPSRCFRFSYATLNRLFYAWRKGGESALALGYRAPVKIRQGQAVGFAQACLRPEVMGFIEAHARLPRPRATFYAYRLNLPPDLRRRCVRLFSARRLAAGRMLKLRAAVSRFARRAK